MTEVSFKKKKQIKKGGKLKKQIHKNMNPFAQWHAKNILVVVNNKTVSIIQQNS